MKTFIGCALLCVTVVLGDFPTSVLRCHADDKECFTKSSQDVFKTHWAGLPEMNLLPFDPIHVNSLVLGKNPASPVNIELKFTDLDLYGLKTAKVHSLKGLSLKGRTVLEATVPKFILKGKYRADGHVLILPIVGDGPAEIICKNLKLKYSFELKPFEKNDQTFVELHHVKLSMKPENVHFQLDNLFNGDKALGDTMNTFINENWLDIYQELGPGFDKVLGLVTKQMINNVLAKYPYEELFL